MRRRTVQPNSRSLFRCFDPLSRHLTEANEERELFQRAQRFWQRKVWTQRPSRGEKLRCKFLARKSAKLFANTKVEIFGKGKVQNSSPILAFGKERCKIHRQFLRYWGDVTSVSLSLSLSLSLSFFLSLSLYLSLSPSAPHAQYRKRFRTSYNSLPVHVHT